MTHPPSQSLVIDLLETNKETSSQGWTVGVKADRGLEPSLTDVCSFKDGVFGGRGSSHLFSSFRLKILWLCTVLHRFFYAVIAAR